MDIRTAQQRAWSNKLQKGFNTTDVPLEFCLMQCEISEAFDAWRGSTDDLGEELADVAIFLMSIAQMTGVDLDHAVTAKIAKNERRVYAPDARTGNLVRVSGS